MKNYFKVHEDFPNKGVNFIDISPVLNNVDHRRELSEDLSISVEHLHVDKVVAIDSRGFLFADYIADGLEAGVVLARKEGKLPGKCQRVIFATEYSTATIEIQEEAIKKGDRVLIHDDVLATGGTLAAVKELIERLGGIVIAISTIIEIEVLDARSKFSDCEVITLHKF